jgi:TonB family protein
MVRFFDQPISAAFVVSGVIHLLLLTGLSLSPPISALSTQHWPISVKLLEITRPVEEPSSIQATKQAKKIRSTGASKKEPVEPKSKLSDSVEWPPAQSQTSTTQDSAPKLGGSDGNISTASSGLEIGESQGQFALVPGREAGVGGGSSPGRGEGIGTAASGTGERGFQEAQPLQTVKASYPPMALRMGLEGDVALKILVDTEGKVIKAAIIKSAGMGFDEEALKTVKQFRFEPAKKDGKDVASEFTYIYRFRLEK